jgi:hypothetical protein
MHVAACAHFANDCQGAGPEALTQHREKKAAFFGYIHLHNMLMRIVA